MGIVYREYVTGFQKRKNERRLVSDALADSSCSIPHGSNITQEAKQIQKHKERKARADERKKVPSRFYVV